MYINYHQVHVNYSNIACIPLMLFANESVTPFFQDIESHVGFKRFSNPM